MSQVSPSSITTGLEPGLLTLRQVADTLGSSTTALRKLIRQGRLPEAEKVKTPEGRIWAIPAESLMGISEREGFSIDLRDDEPERGEAIDLTGVAQATDSNVAANSNLSADSAPVPSQRIVESAGAVITDPTSLVGDRPWVAQPAASLEAIGEAAILEPHTAEPHTVEPHTVEPHTVEPAPEAPALPTLAEVIDAAFLETLLGAKASEAEAMVMAERHRVEFDSLAARQLEVEQRLSETDDERRILAERLHNETLARAIADARVIELRDQLQREITYAEAERYERRQAMAREASASLAAAELKSALGWRARRRLARRTAD